MNNLRPGANDYLELRRGLGFKLKRPARFVREFIDWLEQRKETRITAASALEWATQPQHLHPSEWAARLSGVRAFAQYWSTIDVTTEIPPHGLLPFRARRVKPYLYSETEILRMMEAARDMSSAFSLRPLTYYCLIGLLATTGLRISEALNLKPHDIDWNEGLLTIHGSKFGKSRLVPLHASTTEVLANFTAQRDGYFSSRPASHFFPSRRGNRLDEAEVRRTFYGLSRQIGIRGASASRGPRLHDFRHRFAVETLLRWYRTGEDVERRVSILSTYLGHVHVTDTYWYLSNTPELMTAVANCLEERWRAHS
jgi:integrase/recombinase XerD